MATKEVIDCECISAKRIAGALVVVTLYPVGSRSKDLFSTRPLKYKFDRRSYYKFKKMQDILLSINIWLPFLEDALNEPEFEFQAILTGGVLSATQFID